MSLVYKFGGSSIRSAQALRTIADIICEEDNLSVTVLSATYNSTNELEEIAQSASKEHLQYELLIDNFFDKHIELVEELELSQHIHGHLDEIKNELSTLCLEVSTSGLTAALLDSIYSIGERLSTRILHSYINELKKVPVEFLDARDFIITNDQFNQAKPLFYNIQEKFKKLDLSKKYITQGFIGKTTCNQTTTLGREGSDYTAALISWAIRAEALVIWKDVEGIYQCDPKVFSKVDILKELSYEEAELLTEHGAKVLFPRTMNPLKERGIKLVVKSTFNPSGDGTTISQKGKNRIVGITTREIEDEVILSIVGHDFFSSLNHMEIHNLISKHYDQAKIYEHSNYCLGITIKKQVKYDCVAAVAGYLFDK